ncbi:hypothetical protein OROGR_018805 [Orobanche gracilis]
MFFKIWPYQEILKIRDGTPLEAEEILTYKKSPRNGSVCYFYSKLDVPSNVVQKKRVARIMFFKIWPSQEILKIRDGTPLEAEEILTCKKALETDRVARILFFKIRPSREILKIRDGTPLKAGEILTYIKSPRNGSVCYFSSKFDVPSNVVQNKRVARILFFKIRSSQEILKIRDGTPLEAEEILTYIKKPSKSIVARILFFKIRPSQEILKIRDVARILFFKIWPSQEILKIPDGTPLEAEEILTYIKKPSKRNGLPSQEILKIRDEILKIRDEILKIRDEWPSREILKIRDGTPLKAGEILTYIKSPRNGKRVARIMFFKIWPYQEILKIRDGTPLEAEEILTYKKSPRNGSVCYFYSKLDVPSNVVQKKRVARIMFFKIWPSQEILKIRDGTPLEAEEILTCKKALETDRVARILFFKIRPSREILKIRDGTPLKAGEILTYIKSPRNGSVCYFSSKFDVPSNVVQNKRVARILFFKIRPSQEILKIRDGTPLEAEEILTYIKKPSKSIEILKIRDEILKIPDGTPLEMPSQEILKIRDGTLLEREEILTYIKKPSKRIEPSQEILKIPDDKLDVPSNVVQKKRVARILFFKIRPSQEILKIRDGTPLEAEEILTYIKNPRNGSICYFSSKLDVPSNVVQNKRVTRILFFKIRPSQEILKIRDGTPLEAEEILTYIKSPRNGSVCYFSSKLYVPNNVVQKKRVPRILFFKICPSQEILKILDGTPLEAEEILTYIKKPSKRNVARIMFFKIWPSQEILKIRDGTPLEAEEILTYKKALETDRPSQEILKIRDGTPLEKKRVARILFFKIRPSQEILKIRDEILKIRDGTPLEAEEILTYKKALETDRVARILFFKIRPSQEILKIRDGTPLEAEEILTYIKKPSKSIGLPSQEILKIRDEILKIPDGTPLELDVPSNVVQKKRVTRIMFFKIWPSQEILKIRDGTPLEAEEILTYKKSPRNGSVCYFYCKLDVPSNVVQKKRVARILFFKIRPSQEILKIRDGTLLEREEILTYIKKPSKRIVNKRVARILFFKIWPSQEILKIPDGTPLEAEEILTYIKKPSKRNGLVTRIMFFKIWPSQEILKIRDGTPLEAEEILTYKKSPRNGSVCYFYCKLDVPSNVVQKKRVTRILFFKIRPSQEILKIRDGTLLEREEILTYIKKPSKRIVKKRVARILFFKIRPSQEILKIRDVARILFFKIRPSQEILKIRDGTPLKAEEILTYIKSPRNGSVCYFSSKLYVPSNVVQKKRVPRILFFKICPSQEILKILDGTPLEAEEILTYIKKPSKRNVARILFFKIRPSQEILKIRDGTPLEKKRVARILFFKIRPSQEILKIRDGTPLEAEEILTYIKSPRNGSVCYFSSNLYVLSNVVQKKRVPRILFFKICPSQEILKILDGTPLEAEEILTYIKKPSKRNVARIMFFKIWPSQEILKIRDGTPLEAEEILTYKKALETDRVARILFFKIRPSREILKIRDGTPLKAGEILTYIKSPRNGSVCYFSSKFDVPSNVVQNKRVARVLFFKIRPSQEILKIRDGTLLEREEILTYIKKPSKRIEPSQEILKIRDVARIMFFKIWPSQEILKIRDGTPLEAEEILTYKKALETDRVARILFFKVRPSREILKIRDGTPLKAGEILTYIKSPRNGSVCYFSSKFDVPINVVQNKRVARVLFFKIRPSQEILKIRDGTLLEREEILTYIKKPSKRIEILKIRDGTPLEAEEILTYKKALETDR